MILDHIDNLSFYKALGPGFAKAVDYVQNTPLETLAPGHYPIDGEQVFANVVERVLTEPPTLWEVHDSYADIHLVLSGAEQIGYFPRAQLKEPLVCDPASDCALTQGLQGVVVPLPQGAFAIMLPQDVHMPNIPMGTEGCAKKLILKIQMD